MKAFTRVVDRFCARHPAFGIRNLMLFVVIANAVVFLFTKMDRSGAMLSALCFSPDLILKGQLWRLVTFAFIPSSDNILLLALSLYFYYFIGSTLEKTWGCGKFLLYYLCGLVCTIVYGFLAYIGIGGGYYLYVNSSYINLSMFFAFATLYPENRVLLFFFIPIKIKWLALLDAAFFLYSILSTAFTAGILFALLPVAAILNYFLFCGGELVQCFVPYARRASPNVVNFRRAARSVRREQRAQGYNHKCCVCGRTDAEHPELEFRYCSRCAGYHCFCQDHINNHIHFTE